MMYLCGPIEVGSGAKNGVIGGDRVVLSWTKRSSGRAGSVEVMYWFMFVTWTFGTIQWRRSERDWFCGLGASASTIIRRKVSCTMEVLVDMKRRGGD